MLHPSISYATGKGASPRAFSLAQAFTPADREATMDVFFLEVPFRGQKKDC